MNKWIFIIMFIIISTITNSILFCKPTSFQGRHFIVGFMRNEIDRSDLEPTTYFRIFITPTANDVIVVKKGNEKEELISVSANKIVEIEVEDRYEIKDTGIHKNKLIDIRSKTPLLVWVYSSKNQSSDSYVAIPASIWGYSYCVVSMPNDKYNGKHRMIVDGATDSFGNIINDARYRENIEPRSGEFLVVANLDGTIVKYIPKCDTRNGVLAGDTGTAVLNKGDALLVQAVGDDIGTNDLTGTFITSNNPIGVISGHVRSSVLQGLDNPYDTKDHLLEMLPPTNTWGKKFISIPFLRGRYPTDSNMLCKSGDLIRVVAREDNTNITYNIHKDDASFDTKTLTILKAGDFVDIESAVPIIWESDKPIMLAQFMMHKGHEGEIFEYDPSYVILTPIEQYIEEVTFSTPTNNNIFRQYEAHCFIAITDAIGIYNLFLDGARIDQNNSDVWCQQIGDSEYYWLMKVLKNGTHRLYTNPNNPRSFSGIIYGHGFRDSYSMTLGMRLTDPEHVDSIPPTIAWTDTCGKLEIRVTDWIYTDDNATGIDWGSAKNIINYDVSNFEITDTTTIIDITAKPIDATKDASFTLEFIDKNSNIISKTFNWTGFKMYIPTDYDFGILNWTSATTAIIYIKNNSTGPQTLETIIKASDNRLIATSQYPLPYNLQPNEQMEIELEFTPDVSVNAVNTEISLDFGCYTPTINITGKISAPGLRADDLNFGKVRLFDSKTLVGKLLNAGNISVLIENINSDNIENAFNRIYNYAFPHNLPINDSINYTVTFTPAEIRDYIENLNVINDNNLDCNFSFKGEGGAPNIENIVLDWGKRRIGTVNDTIIQLINSGNFDDTLNYKSNVSITHSTDLSQDSVKKIIDMIIAENNEVDLNFSFIAEDIIPMENIYELSSQWKHHEQITINVKGQGTIPVIIANDYDFGSVPINSDITHEHSMIISAGNEMLTIDSIVPLNEDVAFTIDYNQLTNLNIEPNDTYYCPIRFAPTIAGEHRIYLEITHDANPAFKRSKDTIEIIGNCITENSDLECSLDIPLIYSCQTNTAILNLKNNSKATVIIDSIKLEKSPQIFDATFQNAIQYPFELLGEQTLPLEINLYAEREKEGELAINIYYNNENLIKLVDSVKPITSTIKTSLIMAESSILPGDTVVLKCIAAIEETSEKNFNFEIIFSSEKKLFYCLEENINIKFIQNGKEQNLLCAIEQNNNSLIFTIENNNNLIIDAQTQIEFDISLLALLADTKTSQFEFELKSDRCYYSTLSILDVEVNKVCADDIRQNIIFDNFPYLILQQNLIKSNLDLTINLMESDDITLIITDVAGNIVYNKNKYITKGKYNSIINCRDFSAGQYFITASGKTLNMSHKFIIAK